MPPPKARASCPHPIMSRMPSTIPASNTHADRIPQHLRSIRLIPLSCISGRARTRQRGCFDIKESMDMVDQPLFWNGPNILRPDETMLIDDKGFGHPIDPKVDVDLTRPVHSLLKSLTELTDKPLCGSFVILDIDSDHSNSANLGSFPDPLESRRFLIAGRVAPANPEVHHNDPSAESLGIESAAIEWPEHEGRRWPSNKRRRNRPGVPGKSMNQHTRYRDRDCQRDHQGS